MFVIGSVDSYKVLKKGISMKTAHDLVAATKSRVRQISVADAAQAIREASQVASMLGSLQVFQLPNPTHRPSTEE